MTGESGGAGGISSGSEGLTPRCFPRMMRCLIGRVANASRAHSIYIHPKETFVQSQANRKKSALSRTSRSAANLARQAKSKAKPVSKAAVKPKLPAVPELCDPGDVKIAAQVVNLLKGAKTVLIAGHERPDGDCIGSGVGLCSALRAAGFNAQVVNADPVPERFAYMNPGGLARQAKPGEIFHADVLFVIDSTDLSRLGKLKREQFHVKSVIDIDHHLRNPNFGDVNWVLTEASSTGELIWRLSACCGWKIPRAGLDALYTAIMTDTGQFAYSNTSARVLRIAAWLVELTAPILKKIWRHNYLNKSANEIALESRARASLQTLADGRICCVSLKHSDFTATHTGPQHTEEFASIPRSMAGVQLALFMYEINNGQGTKVSVRTMGHIDATKLAGQFGGGGHRQAAGCTLPFSLDIAKPKVFEKAEALVRSLK